MSDYIKREDVIKALCYERCDCETRGCAAESCPMLDIANAIPSADVLNELVPPNDGIYIGQKGAVVMSIGAYKKLTEHKRGEWVLESLDNYKKYKVTCSCCGWYGVENYDSYVDISDFYFCPYCGADMRAKEGE